MNAEFNLLFGNPLIWWTAVVLIVLSGLYCILVTRNLLRLVIGMELLTKGVTLLFVLAGQLMGKPLTTQTLVITLIVVEVVVIAVAAGLVINLFRRSGSLDSTQLARLKG